MVFYCSASFGAGEQDNKLEILLCRFVKLGVHRMLQIKVLVQVTKPA